MKKIRFLLIPTLLALLVGIGCGSGKDRSVPPDQTDVNKFIQELVDNLEDLAALFTAVSNCTEFSTAVAQIPASLSCTDGGLGVHHRLRR